MSEEQQEKKKDTFRLEREFAEDVGCNGLSYWAKSKHPLQRLFWVAIVLAMTGLMLQQVSTRVIEYLKFESTTSVSREFASSVEYPAVTFCNHNRLFDPVSASEKNAMRTLHKISHPGFWAYAQKNNLTAINSSLDIYRSQTNFSTTRLYEEKGFQLDSNTLISCIFAGQLCSPANFTPVITLKGKCYTFNANRSVSLKQTSGGINEGLVLVLNTRHWDYTEEPVIGNQDAGILFQIHSKEDIPWVETYGTSVAVGTKGYAAFQRRDLSLMFQPWGDCDPENEKKLTYFANYSFSTCMSECYTVRTIEQCGCRTFWQYWAEGFAPECTIDQMINCSSPVLADAYQDFSPEICNCTVPCNFSEYPARMSYSYVPMKETKDFFASTFQLPVAYLVENLLSVDIHFEEIGYRKEVQSKKIDESSLLSDIGGQLGLWVGMSVITLAEFFQYFIQRFLACFSKPDRIEDNKQNTKPHKNNYHDNDIRSAWTVKTNGY